MSEPFRLQSPRRRLAGLTGKSQSFHYWGQVELRPLEEGNELQLGCTACEEALRPAEEPLARWSQSQRVVSSGQVGCGRREEWKQLSPQGNFSMTQDHSTSDIYTEDHSGYRETAEREDGARSQQHQKTKQGVIEPPYSDLSLVSKQMASRARA